MLAFYQIRDERLAPVAHSGDATDIAWIDLLDPTPAEEKEVEQRFATSVPTREEIAEIEVSSRLYSEDDALYMTASLLVPRESVPTTAPVTFILAHDRLITVRYADPPVFRAFVQQAEKTDSNLHNADGIFIGLLEAVIDRTADIIEKVSDEADAMSFTVFQGDAGRDTALHDYKEKLRRLGRTGDLNSKARESLVSVGRVVSFLVAECGDLHPALKERSQTIMTDVRSLSDHATYVTGTITFLLDALLGLISIEQNVTIRIISVISVLIMPPTLVASIYGMNFRFMPELGWRIGYPLALGAMLLAGLLPYLFFRRRGWL